MNTSLEGNSNHRLDGVPGEAIESTVRSWRRLLIQASTLEAVFLKGVSENEEGGGESRALSGHQARPPPRRHEQAILFHFA